MHFIRKDDSPGDFSLINLEQVVRIQVRNEKSPDDLQVDLHLIDGKTEVFKGARGKMMLDYLETQLGEPRFV